MMNKSLKNTVINKNLILNFELDGFTNGCWKIWLVLKVEEKNLFNRLIWFINEKLKLIKNLSKLI